MLKKALLLPVLAAVAVVAAGCGSQAKRVTLHSAIQHKKVCTAACSSASPDYSWLWVLLILNQNNQVMSSNTYATRTAAEDAVVSEEGDTASQLESQDGDQVDQVDNPSADEFSPSSDSGGDPSAGDSGGDSVDNSSSDSGSDSSGDSGGDSGGDFSGGDSGGDG